MEFARYLISQGYRQNQITILVTYRDQLLEFQKVIHIIQNSFFFLNLLLCNLFINFSNINN